MAEVFTWVPDYNGTGGDFEPKVKRAQFGNGYSQRAPDGLNNNPAMWSVSFLGRHYGDEIQLIIDFLEALSGSEYFLWTPPRASGQIKVICPKWSRRPSKGIYDDLTATFEQVYDP